MVAWEASRGCLDPMQEGGKERSSRPCEDARGLLEARQTYIMLDPDNLTTELYMSIECDVLEINAPDLIVWR